MRRAYKFLLRPTSRQARMLGEMLEDHRQLYNAALEERREAWRMRKVGIRHGQQSAQLKFIRAADPDGQGRWSATSQGLTIRRLDLAFQAFYRRVKAGEKPGYPRFKGRGWWDSVEMDNGDGAKWDSVPHPDVIRVYLLGIGHVKVHAHRAVEGRVKTIRVKREGRRWYVVLSCDDVPLAPLPSAGREIGLDVGVARFATTSDGEIIANPRFARESGAELAAAQQALARKRRGSANRRRAKAKVAEVHRRIRNRRADFHHKTARALIRECDVIALEDLRIINMTRSAAGTLAQPGINVAAKSGLNRSILDAGWGQFTGILAGKAEEAGRRIVFVDPRHTSITCHQCGEKCLRPWQALVICPVHGGMDADVNGARNIASRAGLGSGQAARAA